MPSITLFEHQSVSFDRLGWTRESPYLELLDRLVSASDNPPIHVGRNAIKATQFVGLVRVGDLSFQILPKIDYALSGDPEAPAGSVPRGVAERTAMLNLLHMLSYAEDLAIQEESVAKLGSVRDDWFELLTRLFAVELHKNLLFGPFRSYTLREERLAVMRGKWLVAKQLARRPHLHHQFELAYDEFTLDTPLNQVFRHVVDSLLRLTREPSNRRLLTALHAMLIDVSRLGYIPDAIREKIQFNRLNERFQTAYNFAQMFLDQESMMLRTGQRQLFAFVLDMNRLFEQFVAGFIARHRKGIFPLRHEELILTVQSRGERVHLLQREPDGKSMIRLVPDILINDLRGGRRLIVDTKYKRLGGVSSDLRVSESDLYQMIAYMIRFQCERCLLLYPEERGRGPHSATLKVPEEDLTVHIGTINLHRSLGDPVPLIDEFRSMMEIISKPEGEQA